MTTVRPVPDPETTQHLPESGCWLSYHTDYSGRFQVWPTEIEALRAAVENGQQVRWVQWGEELRA